MIQNYSLKVFSLFTLILGFSGLVFSQTTTYTYTGAADTYTVPAGVTSIQIEVSGGQGGDGDGGTGGLGATMIGTFAVSPGDVLDVIVGGAGALSYNSGGGGAGSGVIFSGTPLIIAGGGGGAASNESGYGGQITTNGGNSSGTGGTAGNGGGKGFVSGDCGWSAGGGGFTGDGYGGDGGWDGASPGTVGGAGGGKSWASGGDGGVNGGCSFAYPNEGAWGCGGGGAGSHGGAGGGGYSGGGGGQYVDVAGKRGGAGGGSYNVGTDQVNTPSNHSGDGEIIITVLCDGLTSSVSATEVCFGEEVTLSATSTTGGTVTWDGGITDGVAFTPGLDTTTYTATSDSPTDCSFSVDIIVHALPTVDAGEDTSLCEGAMMMLAGAGNADTYTWTGGVTDSVAFAPTVGTTEYIVTGEDTITGCMNYDTINVTYTEIDETVSVSGITLTSNDATTGATYQWVDCPSYSIISGETAVSFTPQADGEYAVIVSNNGCVDTSACETIAGVGVEGWNESVVVYPNPVHDNLTIVMTGAFNYTIYDLNGRIVAKGTAVDQEQLNLESFEDGVYQIELTNEKESSSIKIVKQ